MQIDLRTGIEVVILLLVAIVLLLIEKPKHRPRVLGIFVVVAILIYAASEILPFVVVLLGWLVMTIKGFGLRSNVLAAGALIFTITLVAIARMFWLDHKDNKAIRNGSKAAFDRRVEDYVRIFGYDREKAIATTARIRDRK